MNFKLELLNKEDLPIFKKDMQEAFQIGFEELMEQFFQKKI